MRSLGTVSAMGSTKRRVYRKRVQHSKCRGIKVGCTFKRGCKRTKSGTRRSYCRKTSNRKI